MKIKISLIQFSKFFFVGVLNTAVDLGVLNLLLFLSDSSEKTDLFTVFKAISFIVAVSFSYLCNKYFVFNDKKTGTAKPNFRKEGERFFMVSAVGFLLNVSISSISFYFLTRACGSQLSLYMLTSVSVLLGSAATLFWNYFGYKLWVFRK